MASQKNSSLMEGGEPEVGRQVWDMDGEEEEKNFPFIDGKEQDVIWTEQLSFIYMAPATASCLQTSTNSSICSVDKQYVY